MNEHEKSIRNNFIFSYFWKIKNLFSKWRREWEYSGKKKNRKKRCLPAETWQFVTCVHQTYISKNENSLNAFIFYTFVKCYIKSFVYWDFQNYTKFEKHVRQKKNNNQSNKFIWNEIRHQNHVKYEKFNIPDTLNH